MPFTLNKETEKGNNIRKIKYFTSEIKYTRCEKELLKEKH